MVFQLDCIKQIYNQVAFAVILLLKECYVAFSVLLQD